jgi:RHS repeat-associated protein
MLTKTVGSNTTSYAWDFENRLTSVTLPGTGGTVTFKYDPFGRRIYKSSSSGTSIFAYDGDNLVEETNSSCAVVARYAQTQNIDEPLAMLRSGATSYYHADGLGSITSLTNSSGVAAETYTYDSFGKRTALAGALTNPFQYTARELDSETGLYYYRARYYDPITGRFLSEDALETGGGDVDFYRYSYDDPTNFTDPYGEQGTGTITAPPPVSTPAPPSAPMPTPRPIPAPRPAPVPIVEPPGLPIIGPIVGAIVAVFIPMRAGPRCLDEGGPAACAKPNKPPECKDDKDCDKRYDNERDFCFREYRNYPNLLRPCLERAFWRKNNCKRGLPDPGPLDPMDPNWKVD